MALHQTQNIVLFFGAGASAWAGYRTFLSFPSLFWPAGTKPSELEATDREKALLDDLRLHIATRRTPPTLDSYLSLIRSYHAATSNLVSDTILRERLLKTSPQWAAVQDLRNLLLSVRERITKLTAAHYRNPPQVDDSQVRLVFDFYEEIRARNSTGELQLFTTNYDLLPEYLFSRHKVFSGWRMRDERFAIPEPPFRLFNGFGSNTGLPDERQANLDGWKTSLDSRSERPIWVGIRPLGADQTLSCYRLHGCVGWLHGEVGDDNVYFDLQPPAQVRSFPDKLCVSYPGHEQLYGKNPHSEAFTALTVAIHQADTVIFVGYSFRDPEVASVIGSALHSNGASRQTRFIIIDPQITKPEIEARLKRATEASAGACVEWSEISMRIIRTSFPTKDLSAIVSRELDSNG